MMVLFVGYTRSILRGAVRVKAVEKEDVECARSLFLLLLLQVWQQKTHLGSPSLHLH